MTELIIRAICVIGQSPSDGGEQYVVGLNGVVRIEAITRPGLHCDIPYVRVWEESLSLFGGEYVAAEFCQHNIVGVYFAEPAACMNRGAEIERENGRG